MGCFVRGGKNGMGCFVRGGKSMWDVLSGVSKNGMGCFVPGCFVLHSTITCLLVNIRIGKVNQYNSNVFFYKLVNIINICSLFRYFIWLLS